MKCEICQCDTYVVHINEKHEKVCTQCYRKEETKGAGSQSGNSSKNVL